MFKVNKKDAIGVVPVSLLLTLNKFHNLLYVSVVNFELVNAGWVKLNQIVHLISRSP